MGSKNCLDCPVSFSGALRLPGLAVLTSEPRSFKSANVNYLAGIEGSAFLSLLVKGSAFTAADRDWTGSKADMSIT